MRFRVLKTAHWTIHIELENKLAIYTRGNSCHSLQYGVSRQTLVWLQQTGRNDYLILDEYDHTSII